ncbi:SNF2 family N-terminal domain-containing protein [Lactifluus subvellereus]|nr:SNF2 family N-terminal domain-containing protein [Lactifluus subvellereus]
MLPQETPRSRSFAAESSLTPASASTGDGSVAKEAPKTIAYIEPPPLSPTERIKYEAVSNRDLPQDFDYSLPLSDRVIVGEYRDNTTLWYYVENAAGIVHRFEASALAEAFPYSVSEYKHRKKIGVLSAFDPSASNVHPDSRPKVFIRLSLKKGGKMKGNSKRQPPSLGSLSDEEWEGDVAEGGEFSDRSDEDDVWSVTSSPPIRRSTRRTAVQGSRGRTDLPFSPRKMRFRKRIRYDSESSETSILDSAGPTRRSNRIRTSHKTRHNYEVGESDPLSDEYVTPNRNLRSKGKLNIPKRGKASRAAYGHIRSIADLEYDELENGPLSAHRHTCERCQREPTHILLQQQRKSSKKNKPKRKVKDEFEEDSDDQDKLAGMGGLKCPLAAHWRCLAGTQRDEILKAVQARDLVALEAARGKGAVDTSHTTPHGSTSEDRPIQVPPRRPGLESHQTTEFICSMCSKGGICMGCKNVALEPDSLGTRKAEEYSSPSGSTTVIGPDAPVPGGGASSSEQNPGIWNQRQDTVSDLLFRCKLCKRLSHYPHLPSPDGVTNDNAEEADVEAIARYYQTDQDWSCADCASFVYRPEKILAWRPHPANAQQPELPPGESISPKMQLPREYLVKWQGRSYRRVKWVPHGWLASVHAGLLRNFLAHGSKVELLEYALREDQVANEISEGGIGGASKESDDSGPKPAVRSEGAALLAVPDAERRIPPAWKTVDRVLDVLMWSPHDQKSNKKRKTAKETMASVGVDATADSDAQREWNETFEFGEEPSARNTSTLEEWEARKEDDLSADDIDRVVWVFVKWDDLGYDEATWDSPPRQGEPGYSAFKTAFGRFLDARRYALKQNSQPDLGQRDQLKLMPFQIDGFNWLCDNWWNHQPCILADEMGLGKTVQIVTFLGNIIKAFDAAPALVVVPHSTITNWAREFASWAPGIRVVPFYGEAKSREVIRRYELTHPTKIQGTTGAKFHVLVTTYDTITSKDFNTAIKNIPRWEVLVVDEGQRLKNDHGLLFKKLTELNVSHRIIMTGTPLNNNIRELFNLMNFLDPNEWGDLEQLEKEHQELTEDLVKELHNRLRPYFLRRLKGQVLQLPPKNEVIVPVSLTPLQKEVYKSVLGKNIEILKTLTSKSNDSKNSTKKVRMGSMNNILMDLRKCIQHPYLVSPDIEPKGLNPHEAHSRLVAGSTKLRLLQALLPKLRSRGHRVLLFSQFVIALDIIEDFLEGEGAKYLRLDGNTKQSERQKGMDEFNRPGSDVFIYLLSTRAGGVGINLWSADTVIIFDPDFNPHQSTERIFQTGKKKLVLDHVIVQKMDDEEGGSDVRSILTYGAEALFNETVASRDITYSEQDLDKLIEKTETGEGQPEEAGGDTNHAFSFAKVWTAENDGLEEMADPAHEHTETVDSWAHTLQLIAEEQAQIKATERTGRGVRRKAAIAAENQKLDFLDSPIKDKHRGKKRKKSRSTASEESDAYVNANLSQSENSSDGPFGGELMQDIAGLGVSAPGGSEMPPGPSKQRSLPLPMSDPVSRSGPTSARPNSRGPSAHPQGASLCAMCGNIHQGTCGMTEDSENLVRYRQILLTNQTGESFEDRRDAIAMIDNTLKKRGQLHLIYKQPLRLVEERKRKPSVSVEGAKPRTQKVPPTQQPSSRPKTSPGPQVLPRPRVGIPNGSVPSSNVSAKDRPLETPVPERTSLKRPSDAPSGAKKKQKTASYPGCPSSKRPSSDTFPASGWVVSKRTRKQSKIETVMALPPLPPIQSDATLAIFVHRSFRPPGSDERFGDSDRLAFLGNRVLAMVIADVLFEKRPMMEYSFLDQEIETALSDASYDQWVTQYDMRARVICPQERRAELMEPLVKFWLEFSALYIERGYPAVQIWIRALVDPDFTSSTSGSSLPGSYAFGSSTSGSSTFGSRTGSYMGHPPPPASPPPPLPSNPLAPGAPKSAFLSLFNQTAMQRGVNVEWNAVQSGPGHALTWTVECLADGIVKGSGKGKSKQLAKEDAARQALQAMGWAGAASGSYYCAFSERLPPP